MAKGLRSSRNKVNNSKLRSKTFGPIEEERKQRLSAKLLELASKPTTKAQEAAKMVDEEPTSLEKAEGEADVCTSEQEMDVEQTSGSMDAAGLRPRSSGRRQKKGRGNAKAAMVFPVYRKGKRAGPHLNKRQRRKSLRP